MPGPRYTEGLPPLQPIIDSLAAHSGVTLVVLVVLVVVMLAALVSVGVRFGAWRNSAQGSRPPETPPVLISFSTRRREPPTSCNAWPPRRRVSNT